MSEMKALAFLWDQKLTKCPHAALICPLAYTVGGDSRVHCIMKRTYTTCGKIQSELEGREVIGIALGK